MNTDDKNLKPVEWMGRSRSDLLSFPRNAQRKIGFALFRAQEGKKHESVKPLQGFGGAGVLEIVASHDGDAFRLVYTVRFEKAIYVLHAFHKKSKTGIATPKQEIALVQQRLREARVHYVQTYGSE